MYDFFFMPVGNICAVSSSDMNMTAQASAQNEKGTKNRAACVIRMEWVGAGWLMGGCISCASCVMRLYLRHTVIHILHTYKMLDCSTTLKGAERFM